jgi:hypothetical protein
MKNTLGFIIPLFLLVGTSVIAGKPNILWISAKDHGPQMGCYGHT